MGDIRSPAALDEIDPDELAELLDRDAADELRALQELAARLEEAGYAERSGNRLDADAAWRPSRWARRCSTSCSGG